MDYEWDESKRASNLAKHGLDFIVAPLIHEADLKVTIPSPRGDETRWVDVAEVAGETLILSLVYTRRHKAVRVISLRRASRKERNLYVKAKDQSLQQ